MAKDVLPGLLKIKTVKKPARPARKNVPNPFKPGEFMDVPKKPASTRVKVLDPKGVLDAYTFGNTHGVDEGLLLAHTRTANQETVLSETNTYAVGTAAAGFPKLIGYHPYALDRTPATFLRPKLSSTTLVQSTMFRWMVNNNCSETGTAPCLDSLARPTSVTKSSSPVP